MNHIYRSKQLTFLDKFDSSLNKLIQDKKNQDLDYAIISWCIELSIDRYFPQASKEIRYKTNQWIQHHIVIQISLEIYRNLLIITDQKCTRLGLGKIFGNLNNISQVDFRSNIKETKNKMSTKSILLIAFVLTGIGLLLFLLNKKENQKNSENTNQSNAYLPNQIPVREKYILALLINSDRHQKLIYSLKSNNHLKSEDSSKLYGATQGLWIGTRSKFD
ncbi:conserved hypothetical protein [Hyella patelloides LEGE 07179]|uniref:Uncharacterized protein n=1 Tax=Hyella patelloides LEGE 07179 TaxID=945734 RepID=A0A563VL61_9CYAN|nr:hypothetical protein [Hyella patelloides]VEP12190.1 conserved hypothetical protein [Hyella patelloides LEGE 07179]